MLGRRANVFAVGPKQTWSSAPPMSAFGDKASQIQAVMSANDSKRTLASRSAKLTKPVVRRAPNRQNVGL
jgi:hypothetical protein